MSMVVLATAWLVSAIACGEAETGEIGECAVPAGAQNLPFVDAYLPDYLELGAPDPPVMVTVTDQAAWDALFPGPMPVPPEIDFATQRVVVVRRWSYVLSVRYVVDDRGTQVLGLFNLGTDVASINGRALGLPRTPLPLRLASCELPCGEHHICG